VSVTANNTFISGNFAGTDAAAVKDDLAGSLSATSSHNLIGGNARLGPLANNGGPTLTHALLPGSPAAAAGSAALAVDENGNPLTTDQRGDPRVSGGTVDIGAAQYQGLTPLNSDQLIVTGSGPGGAPQVNVYNAYGQLDNSFLAFNPGFHGGISVGLADVNGDGRPDVIVGAGPGGGPQVKVIDGAKLGRTLADGEIAPAAVLYSFFAYDPRFTGGVKVAAGDMNGDGKADLITGPGAGGGPHVEVFNGANGSLMAGFFAFNPAFQGGVNVAFGHLGIDSTADIIVGAGPGGGPQVKAFDGTDLIQGGQLAASVVANPLRSFYAYSPTFTAGVTVAVGDVNGDGKADIITGPGPGGGPHVRAFDAFSLAPVASFFAYDPKFTGGVNVATALFSGGATAAIITGPGPGGSPSINVFWGPAATTTTSFMGFDPTFQGGVFVA
jgi:hypothetical protein